MITLLQAAFFLFALWLLVLEFALIYTIARRVTRYVRSRGGLLRVWTTPPNSWVDDLRALSECVVEAWRLATLRGLPR